MAPLALVTNFPIEFVHSDLLQIGSKFGHQVTSLALLGSKVGTLPWNALLALSVCIEFVSSSARVTSVKFAKVAHSLTH